MPGSLLNADVMFPQFTEEQSSDEKIEIIQSYLFMLLEELRYSFGSIGKENFTEASLEGLANFITEPIYVQLYGEGGDRTSLHVTEKGIFSRVQDVENNLSSFQQTAQGVFATVQDNKNGIASLNLTASGLSSKIQSAEGDIASLTQTASALTSRVQSAEGDITTLAERANGFEVTVQNLNTNVDSKISAAIGAIRLSVTNHSNYSYISLVDGYGVQIGSSNLIQFTGDVVFKSDLKNAGCTSINGNNITTGTISAIGISSCDIEGGTITGATFRNVYTPGYGSTGRMLMYYNPYNSSHSENWYSVGGIYLDDTGAGTAEEAQYRMYIYTGYNAGINFAMKLESRGSMSLESTQGDIYIAPALAGASVNIGLQGKTDIYLNGNVYVNGTKIS